MKLLLVGGGGREHALADKLRRDAPSATLLAAPGNPGIARIADRTIPLPVTELEGLADLAASEAVDLTIVGPEAPLAAGLADLFAARELPLFGPGRAAARLESSKAFAKRLMREQGVPTAEFETFTAAERALEYLRAHPGPAVVKASGLAAGKGAIVCDSAAEAEEAVRALMVERRLGDAADEILIEERLTGEELSVFFLVDGEAATPLLPSRDYKRVGEGDTGPNTGGMGAYAPAGPSVLRETALSSGGSTVGREAEARRALVETVRREIVLPVIRALAERGTPYRGFLYAGLMLTEDGPKVIEFNCRLGDPEAQVVLPLTRSSLLEPMLRIAHGEGPGDGSVETDSGAALVTVLASRGYPGSYETDRRITIPASLTERSDLRIYHAGTRVRDGVLLTAGGRVLGVTGLGGDLATAARVSRQAAEEIQFEGKQWRRDIGWHELGGDRTPPAAQAGPGAPPDREPPGSDG